MALITSTDPTSDDVPRIKAALSAAQSILTTSVRVNEAALRVRTESRQEEVRLRVHREVMKVMIEKGQLPPDAMDRFNTLLAEGIDSGAASIMLVEASGIMKAPAAIAPQTMPAIEARAVVTVEKPAVITSAVEPAPPAPPAVHAEPARLNDYDAPMAVTTKAESDRFMNAPFDRPEPKSYAPGRYRR